MVRRTLVLLMIVLLGFGVVVPVSAAGEAENRRTVERRSEITIRGTYDAPARIAFEYDEVETVEVVHVSTADSPVVPPVGLFVEPRLVKGSKVEADPAIVRPDRTAVEEYSLLELLGIGTGVLAVLILL